MPADITLCCGQGCPLNQTCLRCTAASFGRQDFFACCPYHFVSDQCEYYWDDRPSDEKTRALAYQLWEKSGRESGNDLAHWLQAQKQLTETLRNS